MGDEGGEQTLAKLEEAVNSPHLDTARSAVDDARDIVEPVHSEPKHSLLPPDPGLPKDETGPDIFDPAPPPPVPPPMMPPSFAQPPTSNDMNAPL